MLYTWDVGYLHWDEDIRNYIIEEWGSLASFVDYISDKLTIDGKEPYIVGDFQDFGYAYIEWGGLDEKMLEMMAAFDALTTWTGNNPPNKTVEWEEQIEFVEQNFQGYAEICQEYDVDFAPRVFPGFDDRDNEHEEWSENRFTPPSVEYFGEVIELANEYSTISHINIATWNEWGEGHMIEPGYHMGDYFGYDYLEKIKEFLR